MTNKKLMLLSLLIIGLSFYVPNTAQTKLEQQQLFGVFQNISNGVSFISNETVIRKVPFQYANGTKYNASVTTWNVTYKVLNNITATQNYTWYYDTYGFMGGYSYNISYGNFTGYSMVMLDFKRKNSTSSLMKSFNLSNDSKTYKRSNVTYVFNNNINLNKTFIRGTMKVYFDNITYNATKITSNYTEYETITNNTQYITIIYNNGTKINETKYLGFNIYYQVNWEWSKQMKKITSFTFSLGTYNDILVSSSLLYSKKLLDYETITTTEKSITSKTNTKQETFNQSTITITISETKTETTTIYSNSTAFVTATIDISPINVFSYILLPIIILFYSRKHLYSKNKK